jgi:hypothetical protein
MDLDEERKYTGDDFKWDLVVSTVSVPKQENRFDCGAFFCMYCHYISNDLTLDFDRTAIAPFWKRIALQILSGTEYTSLDELSDSSTSEVIVLNDGKGKVSNTVSQNSTVRPHQEIPSSTTNGDDFYVAKLNEKLHDEILEVLESFGCIQNSQEFKFNYYHTTSDDTTEHEVKVFSVAKGLLARLNPQDSIPKNEFPSRNKWIPYSIKYISESDLTDAHTTFPENTRAYTVVPLFEDKGRPITLKLSSRRKRSETVDVALQNGNAYIVRCKNHKGDNTCKRNSIRCAFHCNKHKLCYNNEKIPQSVIVLYILPGPEDVKPPSIDTDETLLNKTGGKYGTKRLYTNCVIMLEMVCVF